jgi:hypothetical protein
MGGVGRSSPTRQTLRLPNTKKITSEFGAYVIVDAVALTIQARGAARSSFPRFL